MGDVVIAVTRTSPLRWVRRVALDSSPEAAPPARRQKRDDALGAAKERGVPWNTRTRMQEDARRGGASARGPRSGGWICL